MPLYQPVDRQWTYRSPGAFPFTGLCAIDGSTTDPVSRLTSRGGSAVAVPTSASTGNIVVLNSMLYATCPSDNPDSEACEIYAFSLALRNGIAPLHVATDCANLERRV